MNIDEDYVKNSFGFDKYVARNGFETIEEGAVRQGRQAAAMPPGAADPHEAASRDAHMGTRHSFAGERKDVVAHLLRLLGHNVHTAASPATGEGRYDEDRVSVDLVIRQAQAPASLPIRSGLAKWKLARVEKFIESNLSGPIRLQALSQLINLSESQFRRAFKAATGVSPHRWILMMRVERAKDLLLEGESKMIDIALATGFVEQSHFNRLFARMTGLPPKVWQRIHRI